MKRRCSVLPDVVLRAILLPGGGVVNQGKQATAMSIAYPEKLATRDITASSRTSEARRDLGRELALSKVPPRCARSGRHFCVVPNDHREEGPWSRLARSKVPPRFARSGRHKQATERMHFPFVSIAYPEEQSDEGCKRPRCRSLRRHVSGRLPYRSGRLTASIARSD